jgi:hypothetical protein
MRERGFVRNARGRWSLAADLEAARDVSARNPAPQKRAGEEAA